MPATIKIPLAALAAEDETGEAAAPGKGDKITCEISGVVSDVTGDWAIVNVENVNGQPVPAEPEPAQPAEPTEETLRNLAAESDRNKGLTP